MRTVFLSALAGLLLLALPAPGRTSGAADKPVVYFGVNLRYHPIIVYERYQPLMDFLTRNTPYRFELKLSRSYWQTIRFLVEGETQVSSIGDGALLEAMVVHGAVPILKPLNEDGRPFYRCYFVVRADSPLHRLQDLKGKRVAFGSKHSTTGNLIPRLMLRENGVSIEDLAYLDNLGKHSTVVRAVLKGEYDAGAVKETVAKKFNQSGWRLLASSDELPSIPLVAGKDVPQEVIDAVAAALLKLDSRIPEHREIMADWDLEYRYGFVPATAADYGELVRLFQSRPFGCGSGCHP